MSGLDHSLAPSSRSAIVVGAGLAGLSAAWRLQQAGFSVKVLEKLDRPGGRVLTLRREGFTIDSGPDAMTQGYHEYRALADEVGLGDRFVSPSAVIGLVRGGRVIDIDTRQPLRAAFTRALSWRAKFRLIFAVFKLRNWFRGVDSFRLTQTADRDSASETAQDFAQRHFGTELTRYLIDPLVRIVAGSGAAQASRLTALGGLVNWSVPLMNILGGLDVLPKAVAERVDVDYGTTVQNVEETGDQVLVHCIDAQGRAQQRSADVCVIATTFDVALAIHPKLASLAADYARQLSYLPLISVSLAYTADTRSPSYVVQVPTVEDEQVLLIFQQHRKAPDRAPPGHSLITLYTDGRATPQFLPRSDEDISAWARERIEALFPELAGHHRFSCVARWPVAGYLATPGFWLRTRDLLAAIPESSRVQIAGDLFGAGSMESAVLWGRRIAERVAARYGAAARSPSL